VNWTRTWCIGRCSVYRRLLVLLNVHRRCACRNGDDHFFLDAAFRVEPSYLEPGILLHALLETQLVKVRPLDDRLALRGGPCLLMHVAWICVGGRDPTTRHHHHEADDTEPHDRDANDHPEEQPATLTAHRGDDSSVGRSQLDDGRAVTGVTSGSTPSSPWLMSRQTDAVTLRSLETWLLKQQQRQLYFSLLIILTYTY